MGGILTQTPIPVDDPIAQPEEINGRRNPQRGRITRPWVDYFTSQGSATAQSPSQVASVSAFLQDASIGATDISNGLLAAGLYRFSYGVSIDQAAGTSSNLEVTLDWTYLGNAKSFTGAAMTGNDVNDSQSGTQIIRIDAASPVRYSTTYASVGVPSMEYSANFTLERLPG